MGGPPFSIFSCISIKNQGNCKINQSFYFWDKLLFWANTLQCVSAHWHGAPLGVGMQRSSHYQSARKKHTIHSFVLSFYNNYPQTMFPDDFDSRFERGIAKSLKSLILHLSTICLVAWRPDSINNYVFVGFGANNYVFVCFSIKQRKQALLQTNSFIVRFE